MLDDPEGPITALTTFSHTHPPDKSIRYNTMCMHGPAKIANLLTPQRNKVYYTQGRIHYRPRDGYHIVNTFDSVSQFSGFRTRI